MRSHDLERVHKAKKGFLGPLGIFILSFGFALSVPGLLLLIFFIKSSPVRIRLYKSSELIESFMKPTQFESLYRYTQIGMKQGLEGQTRAQMMGDFMNICIGSN
jgi:hypothetical protein